MRCQSRGWAEAIASQAMPLFSIDALPPILDFRAAMQQMELLQQYLEAALAEEGLPSLREDCGSFKLGLSTVLTVNVNV